MRIRSGLNSLKKQVAAAKAEAARVTAPPTTDLFDRIDQLTIGLMRGDVTHADLGIPAAALEGIDMHDRRMQTVERLTSSRCQYDIDTTARLRTLAPDLFPDPSTEVIDA